MGRVIPSGGWTVLVVALVVAAVLGVAWLRRGPVSPPVGPLPVGTADYAGARAQLTRLPVKSWDRQTDFDRSAFGEAWSDDVDVEFGHNGCNTRDDILRRDLAELVIRPGTCYAQTGVLHDPYTGATLPFARGPQTSGAVQVDHLVSLADAWYKGARAWDPVRRRNFANDPRNLVAVASKSNFDKAFRDAASWLPPNAAFRCEFVARQVDVKAAYGLWVSAKERTAMAAVLDHC
ncbi:HNH endonuclease family protein [Mycolicibacterium mageritense]|uniref:GmrSD restriction endonucleases C-terminal domain-containing protein n=1 Tax=Mycolicibacterium mageritense TaxID=53462 RepID=A0ABM7HLX6_MYCME|nr:HNH endonuclease family protein [Mycolicibacterium mageritense]MCC9186911.1 HNH endonuclease family protein [Mycolicibacterium mageritense]BBX31507.1 hypothetical protein MMAGJ_07890 [Mycolicibacterium mageritense]CDO25254.1 extracellular deoxyribonuclease [Mycolicibacterium mageritense DSM 44476 = CIP 104973]